MHNIDNLKKGLMKPENKKKVRSSAEIAEDELLVFVGHSDDAAAEAEAIVSLQEKLEREFRSYRDVNGQRSPLHRFKIWDWKSDALSIPGGQEKVVKPHLDRAQIALFVFRERVGSVTWDELEKVRERSKRERVHILTFFPKSSPESIDLMDDNAVFDWHALLVHRRNLASDWNNPDASSVTPCPAYGDTEDLKTIAYEKIRSAIVDLFTVESSIPKTIVQPEVDATSALKLYQSYLKQQLGSLTLTGSPAITSFSVNLFDTFVSLSLSGTSPSETRLYSGDAQVELQNDGHTSTPEKVMSFVFEHHPLLLIIGDPGSGKTTLLKYYALSCLDNGRYKEFGFTEPVNVFYLQLRELKKVGKSYASLPACLAAGPDNHFLKINEALFSAWLEERTTLVLLDGLDEISDVKNRIAVCGWVDKMVNMFTKVRFVVTSRSTGYRKGDGIELEAIHLRADIMDFSKDQKAQFLQRWFMVALMCEIPPGARDKSDWRIQQEQKASKKAEAIIAFLAEKKNRSLYLLAGVPLLLQIMAMLWKDREYLPEGRLELYDAALNYMLDYRDRRRGIDPLLVAMDARRVLSPVSLWMQEDVKKDEADREIMRLRMQEELDTLCSSLPASDFCRNLVERAGLLVEYGEKEYVFRHKSFREYLAGVQIEKTMHRGGDLDELVTHFGDDWWQEVLRFFIGHVDDTGIFDSFMQKLFDSPVTKTLTQKQQDLLVTLVQEAPKKKISALKNKLLDSDTTANRQLYILDCLNIIGKLEVCDVVQKFIDSRLPKDSNVLRRAYEIIESKEPIDITKASDGAEAICSMEVDHLGAQYILIKGGSFTYSLTNTLESVLDLYVAKNTVTNKNYRQFINYLDSKSAVFADILPVETYKKSLFVLAESIKGFSDYLREQKELSTRFRSRLDEDKRFNKEEQPVIGVSFYDARAYCLWLSLLETNCSNASLYCLPTEIEWEYAAGGKESRRYPWGKEEPSPSRANFNEYERATTPVGRYPKGATPEGLYDMAGNVWEWMADWYDENKGWRSLRGAYYNSKPDALRCSARGYDYPRSWGGVNVGFRVIRSAHSSSCSF